jgi:hypothetical protein
VLHLLGDQGEAVGQDFAMNIADFFGHSWSFNCYTMGACVRRVA